MTARAPQARIFIICGIILMAVWLIPKPWGETSEPLGGTWPEPEGDNILGGTWPKPNGDNQADAGTRKPSIQLPDWLYRVGGSSYGADSALKGSDSFDYLAKLPSWMKPGKAATSEQELLIMYTYYETENAFENAQFFINHGLHANAHFAFILMGESPLLDAIMPNLTNVEVFRRENICFDMGGYGQYIAEKEIMSFSYKRFIMLNASIRGPFFPTWSTDCWSTVWLSKISETMKLQGMTSNCVHHFHVQSMIFGTDLQGLKTMIADGTFNCAANMVDAIGQEVDMAAKIMNHGWDVNVWMSALSGDESYAKENRTSCGWGDHLHENAYFSFNVHPYETIFIKANRNIQPEMLQTLTKWHGHMNYSSYDYC